MAVDRVEMELKMAYISANYCRGQWLAPTTTKHDHLGQNTKNRTDKKECHHAERQILLHL